MINSHKSPDAMHALADGFRRFRTRYFEEQPELYKRLVHEGQTPQVLVLACCDSRVHPDIITDTQPGELFVIRNVANLVPPFEQAGDYHGTSAALEFGVCSLQVQHVVILGHAQCGGIRSLMSNPSSTGDDGFVKKWMKIAQPARQKTLADMPAAAPEEQVRYCEMQAICVSIANIMTFPWVRARVEQGKLAIHGWYFDLQAGAILAWNPDTQEYAPLK